ncbi:hypothetical protein ASZ90_009469 [hydrocarbon metagenome]|uniref:Uncharacterized protein n=1 Tax=hydrocarbon metagenome TaxID=938273 RepID=A0A0W8FIT3_9ZZZZ
MAGSKPGSHPLSCYGFDAGVLHFRVHHRFLYCLLCISSWFLK